MTLHEVLTTARAAGIVLEARGDRLRIDAPGGVMTPELRRALVEYKPAPLAVLQPTAFVTLRAA